MSDSVRPHRRQPTRLPCPWDSPGKNTGMGCHFLLQAWKWKVEGKSLSHVQLLATPWTAPPGSSVHAIFQARVLEWVRQLKPIPVNPQRNHLQSTRLGSLCYTATSHLTQHCLKKKKVIFKLKNRKKKRNCLQIDTFIRPVSSEKGSEAEQCYKVAGLWCEPGMIQGPRP